MRAKSSAGSSFSSCLCSRCPSLRPSQECSRSTYVRPQRARSLISAAPHAFDDWHFRRDRLRVRLLVRRAHAPGSVPASPVPAHAFRSQATRRLLPARAEGQGRGRGCRVDGGGGARGPSGEPGEFDPGELQLEPGIQPVWRLAVAHLPS